jgi:hypothetical protein
MMNKTKIKRYMKHYPDLLLLFALLSVTTMIKAQISIRPYSEWEATQFVAVNGHQPEDYVKPDNNWEILYNLRTPRTQAELREMGVGVYAPAVKLQILALSITSLRFMRQVTVLSTMIVRTKSPTSAVSPPVA